MADEFNDKENDLKVYDSLCLSEEKIYDDEKLDETTKPWTRLWARLIDVYLFFPIFLIITIPFDKLYESELLLTMIYYVFLSLFEAVLLAKWGSTPGKWFLNIKIFKNNREKISFSEALDRSLRRLLNGEGLGVPIIAIFTQLNAYYKLKKKGKTSWDLDLNFEIIHGKCSLIRIFCAGFIVFGLFIIYFLVSI